VASSGSLRLSENARFSFLFCSGGHLGNILWGNTWVAGRFSKRRKRYIREEDNKMNKKVMDKLLIQMSLLVLYYNSTRGKSKRVVLVAFATTRVNTRMRQVKFTVFVHHLRSLVLTGGTVCVLISTSRTVW
jgi:hypothetical protein